MLFFLLFFFFFFLSTFSALRLTVKTYAWLFCTTVVVVCRCAGLSCRALLLPLSLSFLSLFFFSCMSGPRSVVLIVFSHIHTHTLSVTHMPNPLSFPTHGPCEVQTMKGRGRSDMCWCVCAPILGLFFFFCFIYRFRLMLRSISVNSCCKRLRRFSGMGNLGP